MISFNNGHRKLEKKNYILKKVALNLIIRFYLLILTLQLVDYILTVWVVVDFSTLKMAKEASKDTEESPAGCAVEGKQSKGK